MLKHPPSLASIAQEYAALIQSMNILFDTPLVYFEQVLELRGEVHDEHVITESLFYMGLIYENKEQSDKAQALYTEALQVAEKHGYKAEQSFPVRHLGLMYLEQGNLDKAKQYLMESLSLREAVGFKLYFPYSHIVVGTVCSAEQSRRSIDALSKGVHVCRGNGHESTNHYVLA